MCEEGECMLSPDGVCQSHSEMVTKVSNIWIGAIVAGSLLGMILAGGFIYTTMAKADMVARHTARDEVYREKYERMSIEISALCTTTSNLAASHDRVIKELEKLNDHLWSLTENNFDRLDRRSKPL